MKRLIIALLLASACDAEPLTLDGGVPARIARPQTVVEDDIEFSYQHPGSNPDADPVERLISVASPPDAGLRGMSLGIKAGDTAPGSAKIGGLVELYAGMGATPALDGTIGIGRKDRTARIITVGRLVDPNPTVLTALRAREVDIDAREDLFLRGPEVRIYARPTASGDPVTGTEVYQVILPNGTAYFATGTHTDLSFAGTTAIQAYSGGLIVQKAAGGKLGFFDHDPVFKPTVSGSWSDGTAAKSVLAALKAMGLVVDATTP